MEFTVGQIATIINGDVEGDASVLIKTASKIEEGKAGSISFLSNLKYDHYLYSTQASAVIVDRTYELQNAVSCVLIRVENAYVAFSRLLEEYQKFTTKAKTGVESPSFFGENSHIGQGHYRGAFSYVGNNCTIGDNVAIHPQVYIGDNVTIGNNTVIHPGARIYTDTIIGNHCTIFANAVIGSDGFGFAPQADGTYKTIPQLGNVILEDYVSIGANATIDCATMGSTIIRKGVKIDNLVQIAHNVEIGDNTVIAAQTGVSGSTKIGQNCVIGGQAGIGGHLSIADRTSLGGQTGLAKSVVKQGLSFAGSPANELSAHFRSHAALRRLPELEKRVTKLEKSGTSLTKNS